MQSALPDSIHIKMLVVYVKNGLLELEKVI